MGRKENVSFNKKKTFTAKSTFFYHKARQEEHGERNFYHKGHKEEREEHEVF